MMTDPQAGEPDDLIGLDEASALLEVPVEQVRAMADQGLITPSGSSADAPEFLRGEVIAARELGG